MNANNIYPFKDDIIDACEKVVYLGLDKLLSRINEENREFAAVIIREFKRNFQQMLLEKYSSKPPLPNSRMEGLSAKAVKNEPELLNLEDFK